MRNRGVMIRNVHRLSSRMDVRRGLRYIGGLTRGAIATGGNFSGRVPQKGIGFAFCEVSDTLGNGGHELKIIGDDAGVELV